ncbi:DMT family transporter [Tropicimonas sediminicola]|uniref:EamA-like transporter family protein n=1 Tax=Tropicimonas sediminicola TaxID=1031541 RepID=A0A239EL93_9RHOB|nr:DMT family transporter [Tropicimonas sediminicola]SNS45397.1 EamA-like transporter family protein [Tropicimonas sediminicola]
MPRAQGLPLYLSAMFLITAMSACVRAVSGEVPLGQIIFWRSAVALVPILAYMAARGELPAALRTSQPRLHVTRNLLGGLSMALSFLSLAYLPVATAQALAYLAPILTLVLAALVGREQIGGRVVGAMALAVAGLAAMIGGALTAPGQGALIGIAAGLGFATTQAVVRVHVRAMTRSEKPSTIAFYFAVTGTAIGLASLPFGWSTPDLPALALLAGAGLLGGMAHVAATEAVARSPVSRLAPLEYTGLIWALGFDILAFGEMPAPAALGGAVLIVLAVLILAIRSGAKAPG